MSAPSFPLCRPWWEKCVPGIVYTPRSGSMCLYVQSCTALAVMKEHKKANIWQAGMVLWYFNVQHSRKKFSVFTVHVWKVLTHFGSCWDFPERFFPFLLCGPGSESDRAKRKLIKSKAVITLFLCLSLSFSLSNHITNSTLTIYLVFLYDLHLFKLSCPWWTADTRDGNHRRRNPGGKH